MENTAYLTADELAKRWRGSISTGTLANWRYQGRGPAYVKVGGRILYPQAKVEEWEADNLKAANTNHNPTGEK